MQNPDIPEDVLAGPDESLAPPGVEDSGPGSPLAHVASVHCTLCEGGCACGYDSSAGGWCGCERACVCPTCSPERQSGYKLFLERQENEKD